MVVSVLTEDRVLSKEPQSLKVMLFNEAYGKLLQNCCKCISVATSKAARIQQHIQLQGCILWRHLGCRETSPPPSMNLCLLGCSGHIALTPLTHTAMLHTLEML